MTVKELANNQKLNYWYNHIKAQQASGLSVIGYCKQNHLTPSVFYDYKKRLKQYVCDEINSLSTNQVVPFVTVHPITTDNHKSSEPIVITKGSIKIEFDSNTNYQSIEAIIKSLLC